MWWESLDNSALITYELINVVNTVGGGIYALKMPVQTEVPHV